jgi:hypothetical protein
MDTQPSAPFARSPHSDDTMIARTPSPRLLVITFHFPPDGAVGGLRWAGLTKYLARRGWEIEVVTASRQDGARSPEPGVRVHHCARRRTLNDGYNEWIGRRRATAAGAPSMAAAAAITERGGPLLRALRSSISMALAFPDFGRGWILRAAWAARRLLRAQRFDAVVTSGPPHSAHIAGALACLGRPGLLWVDMRDPWAAMVNGGPEGITSRHWINRLIPWLERRVLGRAHAVLANTQEFARVLDGRAMKWRVSYLPNGVDLERLPSTPSVKSSGLSISYAGTMYLGRDLTPVVHTLRTFLDSHPEARGSVKLHVAGSMDAAHEARFSSEVAAAGLTGAVEMRGRISPAEALEMINRSHLTLVLAQDQPVQIPAKLYECVALGVPTLVIAESSSAAAREARRIGAITCEPTDTDCMRRLIENLWSQPRASITATAPISYEAIAELLEPMLLRSRTDRSVATELRRSGVGAS